MSCTCVVRGCYSVEGQVHMNGVGTDTLRGKTPRLVHFETFSAKGGASRTPAAQASSQEVAAHIVKRPKRAGPHVPSKGLTATAIGKPRRPQKDKRKKLVMRLREMWLPAFPEPGPDRIGRLGARQPGCNVLGFARRRIGHTRNFRVPDSPMQTTNK
jgi:hypothetical protein